MSPYHILLLRSYFSRIVYVFIHSVDALRDNLQGKIVMKMKRKSKNSEYVDNFWLHQDTFDSELNVYTEIMSL